MTLPSNKAIIFFSIFILISVNCSVVSVSSLKFENKNEIDSFSNNDDVEYWGLIIGVDYEDHRLIDEYSTIVNEALFFYKTLLNSDHWKKDNIILLLHDNATKWNIIKSLTTLRLKADKNDFVLIYFSGHGKQSQLNLKKINQSINLDYPPFDEKDRCDEYLTTYWTDSRLFASIRDDFFSLFIAMLKSENICVVVDSCYSGGMVDLNLWNLVNNKKIVVLTSSKESDISGWSFSRLLTEAVQGYADEDNDKVCSAEEVFDYIDEKKYSSYMSNPTINDFYPGSFPLTTVYFPPEVPQLILNNSNIVKVNETCNFLVSTIDYDNDDVYFGCDWNYERFWSTQEDEWTNPCKNNTWNDIYHIWNKSGIYNIRVKARDINGYERLPFQQEWSNEITTIVCSDDETVDQYCVDGYSGIADFSYMEGPSAQSFKPNASTLSKIKVKMYFTPNGDSYPLTLMIRENLSGPNITRISKTIETNELSDDPYKPMTKWVEFIFNESLSITPNQTYYIILKFWDWNKYIGVMPCGWHANDTDFYEYGESYCYWPHGTPRWRDRSLTKDYCFVTYE
jgi:hypothetical protein